MERYALRLRTLGEGHPTKAILGKEWVTSQLNVVMPFIEGSRKASRTPLRAFAKIAERSNEEFSHYSDACRPGDRLIDLDDNRIQKMFFSRDKRDRHKKHDDPPPKKKDGKISKQFRAWIKDTWTPRTFDLIFDKNTLVMWTDGSALIDRDNPDNTRCQCASAWIITKELRKVAEGAFSAGRATSYDAEVLASAKAANKVWEHVEGSTETLIFASDNIGNLQKIMKPGKGPSQLAALMTNQEAARFLEGRRDRKVIFLWSPSHVGILWNEAVDKLASDLVNDRDVPIADIVSFSFAQQGIRREMLRAWAREYKHPDHVQKANVRGVPDPSILSRPNKYLGNKMWWHKQLKPSNVRNQSFLFKTKGLKFSNQKTAKIARLLTNHFPCGEYRERFKKNGPIKCLCGRGGHKETRDHILFKCPFWIRVKKHKRSPFIGPFGWKQRHVDTYYSRTQRGWAPSDIVDFAYMNPLAATFEWAEILSKCKDDETRGDMLTLNWARLHAHTVWRQTQWLNLKGRIEKGGIHDKPFSKDHDDVINFFDEINDKAEIFAQHLSSQWEHDKEVLARFDAMPRHVVDAGDVPDEEVDEMLRVLDRHPLPRIDSLLDSAAGLTADASQLSDEFVPNRSPVGQPGDALWFTPSPGG
ncbi:hypothetical protein EVJ58_g6681 [Rhodofomes roseus]|uniref:Uncharacterized protein n=1 Tax=Rhodofomes roseus TaxID=34475 RepID=A0A4Y9Y893_9APHY|nr:hypothetical protein EVJ58_g6681 [Rhodofomes roseus]